MMKNTITLVLLVCLSLTVLGQSKDYEALNAALNGRHEATSMTVSKSMLSLIDLKFTDDEKLNKKIEDGLEEVKMIVCTQYNGESGQFVEEVSQYLPPKHYQLITHDEQGKPLGGDTRLLFRRSGLKIKECHLVSGSASGGMVLSFFGDFHVRDLMELKEKFSRNFQL